MIFPVEEESVEQGSDEDDKGQDVDGHVVPVLEDGAACCVA